MIEENCTALGLRLLGDDGWTAEVIAFGAYEVVVRDIKGRQLFISRLDLRRFRDAPRES